MLPNFFTELKCIVEILISIGFNFNVLLYKTWMLPLQEITKTT